MFHQYSRSDFCYQLPEELIARYPLAQRSASRLLAVTVEDAQHMAYKDLQLLDFATIIDERDLLVFNDTRVVPARFYGYKESGGRVEILIERLYDYKNDEKLVRAYLRASKIPRCDSVIWLGERRYKIIVKARVDDLFELYCEDGWLAAMSELGQMPIPPYLRRSARDIDESRYQTIYAKHNGAVAAPTAGLHFDDKVMTQLKERNVAHCFITLHVGAATFQPVRHEDLNCHLMHEEWLCVAQDVVDAVAKCHARGGKVIAIGTTSLRALETAAASGNLQPFVGDSSLFITPGYRFKCVDALFTNFHLPQSTLLMLVSAFAGYQNIRDVYQHAIAKKYRFYSYGDAMFLANRLR